MKLADLPEPARRLRRRILFHLRRAKKHASTIEEAIYITDLESRVETDLDTFQRYYDQGRIPVLMIRVRRAARDE